MKILIIGAGIAGLTSALFISDLEGAEITIVDVRPEVMQSCSLGSASTALWSQQLPARGDRSSLTVRPTAFLNPRFLWFLKNYKKHDIKNYMHRSREIFMKVLTRYPQLSQIYFDGTQYVRDQNIFDFVADDGYFDSDGLAVILKDLLIAGGVKFHFNRVVDKIERDMVIMDDGHKYRFDHIVVAAGTSTPHIVRNNIALQYNMYPVKGYSIRGTIHNPPSGCVVFRDLNLFARPTSDGRTVIGGGFEIEYTESSQIDWVVLRKTFSRVSLGRKILAAPDLECWCGSRPVSIDGLPIVQKIKNSNVFINTGFGSNGFAFCWKAGADLLKLMQS